MNADIVFEQTYLAMRRPDPIGRKFEPDISSRDLEFHSVPFKNASGVLFYVVSSKI
jgi:hypothetical protein